MQGLLFAIDAAILNKANLLENTKYKTLDLVNVKNRKLMFLKGFMVTGSFYNFFHHCNKFNHIYFIVYIISIATYKDICHISVIMSLIVKLIRLDKSWWHKVSLQNLDRRGLPFGPYSLNYILIILISLLNSPLPIFHLVPKNLYTMDFQDKFWQLCYL